MSEADFTPTPSTVALPLLFLTPPSPELRTLLTTRNTPFNELSTTDKQNRETLPARLRDASTIIGNIFDDHELVDFAMLSLSQTPASRSTTFIALSSLLTWAKTTPAEEGETTEDDYRRRKAHPLYKAHIAVEKNIIKLGKTENLKGYVVNAGLIYSGGESVFHYMLKTAWEGKTIPLYGDSKATLPTISAVDYASLILEIADTLPSTYYIVAVDSSHNTLGEIAKSIATTLGNGKTKRFAKEQALLTTILSENDQALLNMSLAIGQGIIKDFTFSWKYPSGIVESVQALVSEYQTTRRLYPTKILIHGPPASGKTSVAQLIGEEYEVPIISVDVVLAEELAKIEARVHPKEDEENRPVTAATDNEGGADEDMDKELLENIQEALRVDRTYPAVFIERVIKQKLRRVECRNRGWVLEGISGDVAKLFKTEDEGESDWKKSLPTHVFNFECTDDLIISRLIHLPEGEGDNNQTDEEVMKEKLAKYRAANTDENTLLNFFDELEIHPNQINVDANTSIKAIVDTIKATVGKPTNYGPTAEVIAEREAIERERLAQALAEKQRIKEENDRKEASRHDAAQALWDQRLQEVRAQEKSMLEAQSLPLRNYLVKYVMPTLTEALIEVCKVKPDDPVDYVAEYLFKHNAANEVPTETT